jgi:hypothetical protein
VTNLSKAATAAAALAGDLTEATSPTPYVSSLAQAVPVSLMQIRLKNGLSVDGNLYRRVKQDLLAEVPKMATCQGIPVRGIYSLRLWNSLKVEERRLVDACIADLAAKNFSGLVDLTCDEDCSGWYYLPGDIRWQDS